jgi:MFS family permease
MKIYSIRRNNVQKTCYGKELSIVLITSLLFFFEFGLNNIFNALQPHIALALNLSPTAMGFISSVFFYVEVVLLIPAGLLLDRYSPKKIILIILLASIIGVVLTALADNILMLFFARVLMGIGGAFGFIACVRIAVNWLHQKHLAQGISLIASIGVFGGFVVQTPLTYAISTIGWRYSLLAVGIIGLAILSLIALVVKDHPKNEDYSPLSASSVDGMTLMKKFKSAFLNKQNFLCGLYASLMNLPIFMLGAMWGITYLTAVNQISEMKAATICSMIFLGTMLGSPVIGFISDKVGKRKLPMQVGALFSLLLILIIILYDTHSFILLMGLYFALGLLTSTQMLTYPTVVENNSKTISSSATSVISMLCMVGGAVAQPIFGYILNMNVSTAAVGENFKMAMWLLPLAFIIAFSAVSFIKETSCKSKELI